MHQMCVSPESIGPFYECGFELQTYSVCAFIRKFLQQQALNKHNNNNKMP